MIPAPTTVNCEDCGKKTAIMTPNSTKVHRCYTCNQTRKREYKRKRRKELSEAKFRHGMTPGSYYNKS